MQDYARLTVSEVIQDINRKYFLPDIQRDFVWKPDQIYALFDSIMRDYPISTFLFWSLDGAYMKENDIKKLEFVKVSTDKNDENTEVNDTGEYYLVLDGQQRLTAFNLVIRGNYTIRNQPYDLYFDALSGAEEDEDGILYEFRFFNANKGKMFLEQDESKVQIWVKVKEVYGIGDDWFSAIANLAAELGALAKVELTDRNKNNLAKLFSVLKIDKRIYFYPEKERDYDKVLDIFVRTNAGGTKLSHSDLLFSTIKSKWPSARKKFDALLDDVNRDRFKFTIDFVLKTALVLKGTSSDEIRYKARNFRPDIIQFVSEEWEAIENAIKLAVDLVDDRFHLSSDRIITSYNSIIPIVYWLYKKEYQGIGNGPRAVSLQECSQIGRWLMKSLLTGVFSGQSDTALFKCKEAIDSQSFTEYPALAIENKIGKETRKSFKVDSDTLDKVKYNSKDSYLVLSVCYQGAVNFKPRAKGNLPEQDHIVSRAELQNAGIEEEKINTIYNIRYVSTTENRTKGDKTFNNWIESFSNADEIRKEHRIPAGSWSAANFDAFIEARKRLLLSSFGYASKG